MRKFLLAGTAALLFVAFTAPLTLAQSSSTPAGQPAVRVVVLEPVNITTGYRASKVIGETVVNEADETIGKVDDLVIRTDDKVFFAILSVGGFLGLGTKLVAVPYSSLQSKGDKLALPGGSKERLKDLPEFKYPS